MKTRLQFPSPRPRQGGFFLVAMLFVIAAIMLIYLGGNGTRVLTLKQEVRQLETRQIERLQHFAAAVTNASVAPPSSAPAP